ARMVKTRLNFRTWPIITCTLCSDVSQRMRQTTAVIRRYRASDHTAVYDICVRTSDVGGDSRGKYHSDDLMPDLFAGPYLFLEPDFAFVLDDGQRAVGYVIGTPDTAAVARAYPAR